MAFLTGLFARSVPGGPRSNSRLDPTGETPAGQPERYPYKGWPTQQTARGSSDCRSRAIIGARRSNLLGSGR